jgi:arylsulfatase
MKKINLAGVKVFGLGIILSQCRGSATPEAAKSDDRPNIILILADDLGYGDTGAYGQKLIETPNIDRLASEGIRFTHFYSGSPVSAPSRCVLLTGKHTGHAQVRGNDEWGDRGDVWNYKAMIADSTLEGQRPLATGTVTLAGLLQKSGYKTGMFGKWGLGAPHTESIPNKMGFDYFFGINCQRMAHTYYPSHLYENEIRFHLKNEIIPPNTPLARGEDPFDPASYLRYTLAEYAPDMMFKKITDFVSINKNNQFFLYWASPIPHVALQAPEEWVKYYVKKFGDEKPYIGDKGYFPHRYPHAAYAAMISYLDNNIGLLVQQLKDLGIFENTIIMFTSDNGPASNGGADTPWFNSGGPFRCDPGFAKGNVNEGGIRVPLIASWPKKIKPGIVSDHAAAFYDFLPTCCEIAGAEIPDDTDGISFLPELSGKEQKKHEFLYWEFSASGGQQAVRIGNIKVMRKDMHKGNSVFQAFDLEKDPGETNDIAGQHPEIIKKANEIILNEHQTSHNQRWRFKQLDAE